MHMWRLRSGKQPLGWRSDSASKNIKKHQQVVLQHCCRTTTHKETCIAKGRPTMLHPVHTPRCQAVRSSSAVVSSAMSASGPTNAHQ